MSDARAAVDRILSETPEADDVLRAVVALLAGQPGTTYAAIAFVEDGAETVGPESGVPDPVRRSYRDVVFQGERVGALWLDGDADPALADHVAAAIATHVLIGWDTGGAPWVA
ncbi:MAG: hypothetical protein FJW96_01090 [Actinobacteria bacterium]|nr:hypothetical protein [Actinomycetota bacterium]